MIARLTFAFALLLALTARALALEVSEFTTPAGISVRHVEDSELPLIAMNFIFPSGGADDPVGKEGAAAFLTTLTDEGAGTFDGKTFRALRDDHAVRMSFTPTSDNIHGAIEVPSAQADIAFNLLRAVINEPALPQEAIERMRKSFLVDAKSRENDPGELASLAATELILKNHPYCKQTRGTQASIKSITRDDLIAAHRRLFVRQGLKVAIVGDISREEATKRIDEIFGALPSGGERAALPEAPAWPGAKVRIVNWDMPQSLILFGGRGVPVNDPDYFAAAVLMEIVGGNNSRLNAEVREKRGLTYGVGYGLSNLNQASFSFGSMATPNAKAGEAIEVVRAVFRDIRDNGPTEAELNEAKDYLKGTFAFRYESLSGTSSVIASNMAVNLPANYHKNRNDRVSAVTLEQVKKMAKRLLDPDNMVIVAAGKPVGLAEK